MHHTSSVCFTIVPAQPYPAGEAVVRHHLLLQQGLYHVPKYCSQGPLALRPTEEKKQGNKKERVRRAAVMRTNPFFYRRQKILCCLFNEKASFFPPNNCREIFFSIFSQHPSPHEKFAQLQTLAYSFTRLPHVWYNTNLEESNFLKRTRAYSAAQQCTCSTSTTFSRCSFRKRLDNFWVKKKCRVQCFLRSRPWEICKLSKHIQYLVVCTVNKCYIMLWKKWAFDAYTRNGPHDTMTIKEGRSGSPA